MKYLSKLIYNTTIVAGVLVISCNTDDLKELNVNPTAVSTINVNFILTTIQLGGEACGGSLGDNRYIDWRTNIGLCASTIQQTATYGTNANGPITSTGDKYLENVETYTGIWDDIYRDLRNVAEILKQTGPGGFAEGQNNNTRQAAIILRAFCYHRLTDFYGRVPFSDAQQAQAGVFFPHYDKQKDIYLALLRELDSASTAFSTAEDPDFGAADLYYNGDVTKWKKFGYSLMLRMAMRMSTVDAADANTYVAKAIAGGVFQSNADNILVPMAVGPSLWTNQNGISRAYIPDDGGEAKDGGFLSKTLIDFLKGPDPASTADDDPRLMIFSGGIYNWPSEDQFSAINTDPLAQKGMPNGKDLTSLKAIENNPGLDPVKTYSRINPKLLQRDDPYMIFNYGEVELLLAEAAQRGIGGLTPAAAAGYYTAGVKASMEMYTVFDPSLTVSDAQVTTYLATYPFGVTKPPLEMIADQYWANHFMNWWEAWTNWRRTGFPVLVPTNFPGNVTGGKIFQRLKYPTSEVAGNPNFDGASPNDFVTKVWWAGGPE